MPRTITVELHYDAPAEMVWNINTSFETFERLMAGLVRFEGLPNSGQIYQGQVLDIHVSLLGKLPPTPFRIDVLECDHDAMRFCSSEQGAGVKTWLHTSQVRPKGDGCVLTDSVVIDAGWKTWAVCQWAKFIYRKRHGPRLDIIAERLQA